MDDVIRVIEDSTRELEQLAQRGAGVCESIRDSVGTPVANAGEGSSSSVPGEVQAGADAAAKEIERAMELLRSAVGKLNEYRDYI